MTNYFKGVAFPFRFGANGGLRTSALTPDEHERIYYSIYQILFTYKNERINNADIGSRLREYLFEPYDDISTLAMIKHEVQKAIAEQEERVEVLDVRVYAMNGEEGKIYIDIDVLITQFATETTLEYEFSKVGQDI